MQIGILWITVVMFGSIIAGSWIHEPLSIIVGVGITLMSVLGYYLLPQYFWIWVAVFAGLPLIGISIYYLRQK
jgi:ABC-type amino acid transport system permease subunit